MAKKTSSWLDILVVASILSFVWLKVMYTNDPKDATPSDPKPIRENTEH